MSSLDSFPPEVLDMIIDRLSHDGQVSLSKVSHHFKNLLPRFELKTLELAQWFSDELRLSSCCIDHLMSQRHFFRCFFAPHKHSRRAWTAKGKNQKVNCFRTFSFPSTAKFSFFGAAKIDNLEMDKGHPVYLDNDNIDHLTSLLSGCIVNKINLIIDKQTLEKEVTFSGTYVAGRAQKGNAAPEYLQPDLKSPRHDVNKPSLAFDVLLNLIGAGIEIVNVNEDSLENENKAINRTELDEFIAKLSEFGHSSKLNLNVHSLSNELKSLRNEEKFENGHRRVVNVVRKEATFGHRYLLTIEVHRM